METTEYIPYGPEWVKEMNKLPKDVLIDLARKAFVKEKAAAELLKECEVIVECAILATKTGTEREHFCDTNIKVKKFLADKQP